MELSEGGKAMTEEELKQKQKKLDEAFLRYMEAEKEAREAKGLYEKWVLKMQWATLLAGVAIGISAATFLFNLARLLS